MLFSVLSNRRGASLRGGEPSGARAAIVGLDSAVAAGLGAMLDARGLHLERFDQSAALLEAARARSFRLLACGYPLPDLLLRSFLERLRAPDSASRRVSVLVITIPELVAAAEQLVGRGANAVLRRHDPRAATEEVLNRLLQVAPRLDVGGRVLARVGGEDDPPSTCKVLNLSVSGALLECPEAALAVGSVLHMELSGEGLPEPVRGHARVVRRTVPGREPSRGFALQFVNLEPSGWSHLEQLLACA